MTRAEAIKTAVDAIEREIDEAKSVGDYWRRAPHLNSLQCMILYGEHCESRRSEVVRWFCGDDVASCLSHR